MASLRLFLWRLLAAGLPAYTVRHWLFRALLRNRLGPRATLHRGLEPWCVGGVGVGAESTIGKHVDLDGRGGLEIGRRVSVSAYVRILTASHTVASSDFRYETRAVKIDDYAWVGTGAMILPGVRLGEGCVVAAGSVVTKDVEPYAVVAGNPARPIGKRPRGLDYSTYWRPPLH